MAVKHEKSFASCDLIRFELKETYGPGTGDQLIVRAFVPSRGGKNRLGYIVLHKREPLLKVDMIRAHVSRCGIGTRLYEQAAKYAYQNGLTLASDTARTRFSEAFWKKQVKKGRAICVGRHGTRLLDDLTSRGNWRCGYYTLSTVIPGEKLSGRRR